MPKEKQPVEQAKRHVEWRANHECVIVAFGAQSALARGAPRLQALKEGQKLLPRSKRKPDVILQRDCAPSSRMLDIALAKLKTMSREHLQALLPNMTLPDELPSEHAPYVPKKQTGMIPVDYMGRGKSVSWDRVEEARLARRMQAWIDAGSDCGLVRLAQEAQEIECPPARRRPRQSLAAGGATPMQTLLARGLANAHLVVDLAFDPLARAWTEPNYTRPASQQASPPAEDTMSRSLAQEQREVEAQANPLPTPEKSPVEASGPLAGPSASTPKIDVSTHAHEHARVFGIELANFIVPLMGRMLSSYSSTVLREAQAQQREQARELVEQFSDTVTAANKAHSERMADMMTRLLVDRVNELLGGATPAAKQEQPFDAVQELRAARVKIDVVGIEAGAQRMLVKKKLNGNADRVDIRFIGSNDKTSYEPSRDRVVIMLKGRISHSMSDIVKKAGCTPHYVDRSVGDVVQAIEHLLPPVGPRAH